MRQRFNKFGAISFILLHLFQLISPSAKVFAGNGNDHVGATTSTNQYVNPSTGDFSYSIPLLDIEGYPITLNYNAGIPLDQEASWVGLGWSLNPGAINRQMRGIPDDFKGEEIVTSFRKEENITKSGGLNLHTEFNGYGDFEYITGGSGFGFGLSNSTYTGLGFQIDASISLSLNLNVIDAEIGEKKNNGDLRENGGKLTLSAFGGLNTSVGNQTGVTQNYNRGLGLSGAYESSNSFKTGGSLSYSQNTNTNSIRGYSIENQSLGVGVQASGSHTFNQNQGETQDNNKQDNSVDLGAGLNLSANGLYTKSFPMGAVSFTPRVNFPKRSTGNSYRVSLGAEIYGIYGKLGVIYSEIKDGYNGNKVTNSAYGTMFMHLIKDESNALKDFNREGDKIIYKSTTTLPFSYATNDRFILSSARNHVAFQTKMGAIGIYSDPTIEISGDDNAVSGETGMGSQAELGVNTTSTSTYGSSGKWKNYFGIKDYLNLYQEEEGEEFEPYYFKASGELTEVSNLYEEFGEDDPVAFGLKYASSEGNYKLTPFLEGNNDLKKELTTNKLDKREQRLTSIYGLSSIEAKYFGLIKNIENYSNDTFNYTSNGYSKYLIDREEHSGIESNQQLSEFHVTHPGGTRDVYGIPSYNRKKIEASFNVYKDNEDYYNIASGLTHHTSTDNSLNNNNGIDHFFKRTEIPGYAETFLLTSALSSDYEDVTQNGPSVDDIGNYVKFNYSKVYDNYRFRTPYQQDSAYFESGVLADEKDDKGSYVYGEKEVWYLHSAESKNLVVEFVLNTEDRHDGHGVLDENGGLDANQKLRYLKQIKLYTKEDKLKNGSSATPLKTIIFHYNYSLCQGTPDNDGIGSNNEGGKLTLERIEILGFESRENENKFYEFEYGYNPNYKTNAKDRWGYYKPNVASSETINSGAYTEMTSLTNGEYPFTPQTKAEADLYASAWCLSSIKTPTGGEIEVEYESDTYAYVQNVKAMKLYPILGFIHQGDTLKKLKNYFMVVDLGDDAIYAFNGSAPVSGQQAKKQFVRDFLADVSSGRDTLNSIFYKAHVNIVNGKNRHEMISGYTGISAEDVSLVREGDYYVKAIIPIEQDIVDGESYNPIRRMAWQYGGDYLSRYIIEGSNLEGVSGYEAFVLAITGIQEQIRIKKQGFYKYMKEKKNGLKFFPNRSFVKLYDSDGIKYGGGHRVKRIIIRDNWEEFSDYYGTEYSYHKYGYTETSSTGVASNEPFSGGEDNAIRYDRSDLLSKYISTYGRKNLDFVELPFIQSVLPTPIVAYGEVTKKSIEKEGVSIARTGYEKSEFYTAKDFPFQVGLTKINSRFEPMEDPSLFSHRTKYVYTASQGYSIVLNDMHGKPKREAIYGEDNNLISSIDYKYKVNGEGKLDNEITVIDKEGQTSSSTSGIDVSICIDSRQSKLKTTMKQKQYNVNVVPGPYNIPIPVFGVYWFKTEDNQVLRTATVSKIIQKYAVLEEVITKDEGAEFSKKNTLYDDESRGAIVSTATNYLNPNKNIVNYSYPAYWNNTYPQFGPAYKTIGMTFGEDLLEATHNSITDSNLYITGAEVEYWEINTTNNTVVNYEKTWVSKQDYLVADELSGYQLIKQDGSLFTKPSPTYHAFYRVLRPGELNMTGINAQVLSTLKSPSTNHASTYAAATVNDVLSASAQTFQEDGQVYGFNENVYDSSSCISYPPSLLDSVYNLSDYVNPFITGLKGMWNTDLSYAYKTAKNYQNATNNQMGDINLSSDGTFSIPLMYRTNGTSLIMVGGSDDDWLLQSDISRVNNLNGPVESKDLLGLYSSASFSTNATTLNSEASNSMKNEQFFEGFEDKALLNNSTYYPHDVAIPYANGRWALNNVVTPLTVTTNYAHTGEYSTVIETNDQLSLMVPVVSDTFFERDYTVPMHMTTTSIDQGYARHEDDQSSGIFVSFWVHQEDDAPYYTFPDILSLQVCGGNDTGGIEKYYESKVIDSWKLVTYYIDGSRFANISAPGLITIDLNNTTGQKLFIDDFKVYKEESVVGGNVITAEYMRNAAALDAENFSTQYHYNSKGQVSGVAQETDRGKQTISVTRQSIID